MQLKVIGSGSKGNMYVLTANNGDNIIIEAGFRFDSKSGAFNMSKAMNFDFSKTLFALCSHAHGDHAKGVVGLQGGGVDVVMSAGTAKAVNAIDYRTIVIKHGQRFKKGDFTIAAFKVNHDCPGEEPVNFLIDHPESGTTLFLTDTYYTDFVFPGLNNLLIEANFCEKIMAERYDAGKLHGALRDRICRNHLSLNNCLEILRTNDLSAVNNICLIHLSDSNSDSRRFQSEVFEATLKNVTVAEPGLNLRWNKTPFG